MAKISILIAFLPYLLYAQVQRKPLLCSEYFKYITQPGTTEILGQIEISPPSANDTFYLKVALNINAIESPNQFVRLELARSIPETVEHVHYGRPLLYYIYYPEPMQEPIPTLSAIWFNNQRYCPGPETRDNITATIELGHILYPPNKKPFVYNYRPWQEISQVWHRNASIYRIDNPDYSRLNKVFDFELNKCGITDYYNEDTNRLISDGEKVLAGQWPWLAVVFAQKNDDNPGAYGWCSGTILTTRHIITAGSCVMTSNYDTGELLNPERMFVSLGQRNSPYWNDNHPGIVNLAVKDYKISSSNLNPNIRYDEVAILILKTAIEYNAFIKPICLWSESFSILSNRSSTGYVVGWGYAKCTTSDDMCHYDEEPRMAKVPIGKGNSYSKDEFHLMPFPKQHRCYADTGTGLVVYNTNTGRYQLYGVTLFCMAVTGLSRYFEILRQVPWILEQISTT